jgi:alpha-tubulin suppressor-like RCC1 family protein
MNAFHTNQLAPVTINGLSNVVALSSHSSTTCALINDGTVKCWGYSGVASGNDWTPPWDTTTPTTIAGVTDATAIATGLTHACALTASGGVKCWGGNGSGQLGNGTVTNSNVAVDVDGLTSGVVAITAMKWEGSFSCAALADGGVKCWGYNGQSQLGDHTTNNRIRPVSVLGIAGSGYLNLGATTRIGESDQDCFFSWAESHYPALFSGAGATQTLLTYSYRYYSGTGSYLGLNSADSHAYAVIPALGGSLMDIGASMTWVSGARNDSCR